MQSKFIKREIAGFALSREWMGDAMLFIAGPRQCGKTSLAKKFLEEKNCLSLYYNWDVEKVRRQYRADPDFFAKDASKLRMEKPYMVFDEIHKLARWKNILKGVYDEYKDRLHIIVTGSARLDLSRRSGESLVGRYAMVHLLPFSLREWAECVEKGPPPWLHTDREWENTGLSFEERLLNSPPVAHELADAYFRFGPFPAPLLSGSEKKSRKWHRDYIALLIREDLRDLTSIRDLNKISHLADLLPARVGAPLSLRSLGEDLEANHSSIKSWLEALQLLYLIWPLYPYSNKLHRVIRKEPKWYFMDWTYAAGDGAGFENMIASSLYQFITNLNDQGYPELKLHFIRTYDKKEIDFLISRDGEPILAVEAKSGSVKVAPQLRKFRQGTGKDFPIVQVVKEKGVFLKTGDKEYVAGYDRLLMAL